MLELPPGMGRRRRRWRDWVGGGMSVDARPEQQNGDGVDCWYCGNSLTGNEPTWQDAEGFTYHLQCASPRSNGDDMIQEAIKANQQFASMDEVQQTIELPIIESLGGRFIEAGPVHLRVSDIEEFVEETQFGMMTDGWTPDSGQFFEFTDNLSFDTDAPDPNDPEWDGYSSEVWFGFPDEDHIEVIVTYYRP